MACSLFDPPNSSSRISRNGQPRSIWRRGEFSSPQFSTKLGPWKYYTSLFFSSRGSYVHVSWFKLISWIFWTFPRRSNDDNRIRTKKESIDWFGTSFFPRSNIISVRNAILIKIGATNVKGLFFNSARIIHRIQRTNSTVAFLLLLLSLRRSISFRFNAQIQPRDVLFYSIFFSSFLFNIVFTKRREEWLETIVGHCWYLDRFLNPFERRRGETG